MISFKGNKMHRVVEPIDYIVVDDFGNIYDSTNIHTEALQIVTDLNKKYKTENFYIQIETNF